jgi:hypothetical protein
MLFIKKFNAIISFKETNLQERVGSGKSNVSVWSVHNLSETKVQNILQVHNRRN